MQLYKSVDKYLVSDVVEKMTPILEFSLFFHENGVTHLLISIANRGNRQNIPKHENMN